MSAFRCPPYIAALAAGQRPIDHSAAGAIQCVVEQGIALEHTLHHCLTHAKDVADYANKFFSRLGKGC